MRVVLFVVGVLVMSLVTQPVQAELEFGIPEPLPFPINEENGNGHPWIFNDELTLYFSSARPGNTGFIDIWRSERGAMSDPWQTPVNLGAPINTAGIDYFPSVTEDELELYFTRTTDFLGVSDGEIWISQRTGVGQPWGAPEKLTITQLGDGRPSISSDGLELYFNSFGGREPPSGFPQVLSVWHASRASRTEPFGEPEFVQIGNGTVALTGDGLTLASSATKSTADFYGFTLFDPPDAGLSGDIIVQTRETTGHEFGAVIGPTAPLSSSYFEESNQFGLNDSSIYIQSTRPGLLPTGDIAGVFGIWRVPIAEAVPVDVNPGGGSESIDWLSETILPVTIMSNAEFAALDVDTSTLLFGDPLMIADGASPVSPLGTSTADVNGDGLPDLTLEFSITEMRANGVIGLTTEQGYFAGEMLDGTVIAGRDHLSFIPEPSSLLLLLVGLLTVTICRRGSR